jgi:plasmid stabilization system protein ParE
MTPIADEEINGVVEYLDENFSSDIAMRYFDYIYETIRSLSIMPNRCPLVRNGELRKQGYRWVPVENYTVYFIVNDEKSIVRIERIMHSSRDYTAII